MNTHNTAKMMFSVLVKEHTSMLVSFITAVTGTRQDTEDIAQEVFIRAYRNFSSFGKKGDNFGAWLRAIARNYIIDLYRKNRADIITDPEILEGMEDVFEGADSFGNGDTWSERIGPLKECLQKLPEKLNAVCRMHYLKGLAAKIVAEHLEVKLNAVLKRLERARTALRECIERKLGLVSEGNDHGV